MMIFFQAKRIFLLLSFFLLNAPLLYAVQIGTVLIEKKQDAITITNGKDSIWLKLSDSIMEYVYIITTPYVKYAAFDGVPRIKPDEDYDEISEGLKEIPDDRDFEEADFPKFAMGADKKTWIGLMEGVAGGSGGSSQTLHFFDTGSKKYFKVETFELFDPEWISPAGHPIGFIERNYIYLYGHAVGYGGAARIRKVHSLKDGQLVEDAALLREYFEKEYAKAAINDAEFDNLRARKESRELACKLVDRLYYGVGLGKDEEIESLLSRLDRSDIWEELTDYHLEEWKRTRL